MRSTTPPGWYPDWDDPDLQRYWDGTEWTDEVTPYQQGTPRTPGSGLPAAHASRRTMWLAVAGIVLLVGGVAIGAAAAGGDDGSGPEATSPTTVTVTAAPAETSPADGDTRPSRRFPKQAGDWRLEALRVTSDDGNFIAGGDLTYLGGDQPSGESDFTVLLFNNSGEVVATLRGSVTEVAPGQTVTTDFSGTDPYRPGKFPSSFEVDS